MTNQEYYMLVRKGIVQHLSRTKDGRTMKVWPLAKTQEDAQRLCEYLKNQQVRPAKIGSIPGETNEGLIEMMLSEGCVGMCCVLGWEEDGSPKWGWIHFD